MTRDLCNSVGSNGSITTKNTSVALTPRVQSHRSQRLQEKEGGDYIKVVHQSHAHSDNIHLECVVAQPVRSMMTPRPAGSPVISRSGNPDWDVLDNEIRNIDSPRIDRRPLPQGSELFHHVMADLIVSSLESTDSDCSSCGGSKDSEKNRKRSRCRRQPRPFGRSTTIKDIASPCRRNPQTFTKNAQFTKHQSPTVH